MTLSNRPGFRGHGNVYFLDATKVEDIVDFWNLRAIGKQVVPVPKQLTDDPQLKQIVVEFLTAHRRSWPHNPQVYDFASIIRARNCTMAEVQEYAKTLKLERAPNDPSTDPFFAIQHWYPRVWDDWARDKDGAVPADVYGEEETSFEINDAKQVRIRFQPLLPKFAQKHVYHSEPRCANELSFRFYGSDEYFAEALPKASGENYVRAVSGLTSFRGDWRVGRNGLVKLVRDDFTETRDIPAAESVMFAWLADLGWKPKLSPPGLLAKKIYKKLDGSPMPVLTDEKLLGLLEYMNGGSLRKDGTPAKEGNDEKTGPERYLPVAEIKSRLQESRRGSGLHNYLLSKGVFELGLRTQCPNCFRNFWSSLREIQDTLTCPKCQEILPAIGNLDSATWCYRTSGPFSVPKYADGAYAVLLALEFFNGHSFHRMRVTPTLSFTAKAPNKKDLEADFALFWEESIFGEKRDGIAFGECKTYGRFERKRFRANAAFCAGLSRSGPRIQHAAKDVDHQRDRGDHSSCESRKKALENATFNQSCTDSNRHRAFESARPSLLLGGFYKEKIRTWSLLSAFAPVSATQLSKST